LLDGNLGTSRIPLISIEISLQINFLPIPFLKSKNFLLKDQAAETICVFVRVAAVSHEIKAKLSSQTNRIAVSWVAGPLCANNRAFSTICFLTVLNGFSVYYFGLILFNVIESDEGNVGRFPLN
jgi:hypothetical protein